MGIQNRDSERQGKDRVNRRIREKCLKHMMIRKLRRERERRSRKRDRERATLFPVRSRRLRTRARATAGEKEGLSPFSSPPSILPRKRSRNSFFSLSSQTDSISSFVLRRPCVGQQAVAGGRSKRWCNCEIRVPLLKVKSWIK